ncbi:ATP-binding protein [Candidatus Margulisiibacteriota bacterium]
MLYWEKGVDIMQDFLSFNPKNKDTLSKVKFKLGRFTKASATQNLTTIKPVVIKEFKILCDDLLDQIKNLEQEMSDLYVILEATLQHNTDLENEFKIRNNQISEMCQKYEFIVNTSRDWMCLINNDYTFEAVNEAFFQFLNISKDKALANDFYSFWGQEFFTHKIKPSIDMAFQGKSIREKIKFRFPHVGEKNLDICFYPFHSSDNTVSHLVFIAKDITKKCRAESLLKERSNFLNKVKDAIFIFDKDFKISFWNKGAEQLFGWSSQEAIKKDVLDLLFVKQGKRKTNQILKNMLETGKWHGQIRYITKDKQDVIADSQWTPIKSKYKNKQNILVVNTDITEKKNLESEFFRSQRADSLGILASEIAHELNNVLTLFLMSISTLKPKLSDIQSQTMLSLLESSAKRGGELVRQILQFSRGIDADFCKINIIELANEFHKMVFRTFPANITFNLSIADDILPVHGNKTQLFQVLLNLCINARDAMPKGGAINISFSNIFINEELVNKFDNPSLGWNVLLTISDTGSGIPKKYLDKIFQPFFTTKELEKGTGLGLSTVSKIIKNHKGSIKIESRQKKGTKIYILVPSYQTNYKNA